MFCKSRTLEHRFVIVAATVWLAYDIILTLPQEVSEEACTSIKLIILLCTDVVDMEVRCASVCGRMSLNWAMYRTRWSIPKFLYFVVRYYTFFSLL